MHGGLGPAQLVRCAQGLGLAAVTLVLGFQFCVFLRGALKEKGGHV